ncbi:DUF58 domain-containing protein [Treponema sp. TIM-1]|uniref:DUF58 domain-containing protein n=1 Tax=Treponema sp. TIM-1 TaxID=2898417 RepID=UPI0039811431
MRGSIPLNPSFSLRGIVPIPRFLGIAAGIVALLALAVGGLRKELVLTLMNSVYIAVLAYSFLGVLILAGAHKKNALALSVRLAVRNISPGSRGELLLTRNGAGRGHFFRFPGILVRYELQLATRDGRIIRYVFDPDNLEEDQRFFPVRERGAYYSAHDGFIITDCLGFFRVSFPIPQDGGPRLLALPAPAEEPPPVYIQSGGNSQRTEFNFQRTDDLTDHRPYIPGDDPRRINWKLYGHGGELFVREGEPEPPPHSRLVILVDTQADPLLFTPETARSGVDLLCENALALALEYLDRGMDMQAGYTGGAIRGGSAAELAEALAYPAALPLSAGEDLPEVSDRGVLLLALPRDSGEPTALDRFLRKRGNKQGVDLVFLYRGEGLDEAAETCVRLYHQKAGFHVRCLRVR